ncbi:MAG: hypothetical protein HY608_05845, partial [Planctomycetes bacterium]|nr:hypothetical protein [Planctomycetota bacterium]
MRVFELHPAHGRKGAHAALPVLNLLCWQDGKTCFAHCLELDIAAD